MNTTCQNKHLPEPWRFLLGKRRQRDTRRTLQKDNITRRILEKGKSGRPPHIKVYHEHNRKLVIRYQTLDLKQS